MNSLIVGIVIMLFGFGIGGVGLASAGIGIGIPMLPVGFYLIYRGWRILRHQRSMAETGSQMELQPLEKTKIGRLWLCFWLFLIGVGTSALLIGIPIMVVAVCAAVYFLIEGRTRGRQEMLMLPDLTTPEKTEQTPDGKDQS